MATDLKSNGYCTIHSERLERIEKDVHFVKKETTKTSNFKAQGYLIGVILLTVWGFGFLYSYNHISFSIEEHDAIRKAVKFNVDALRVESSYESDKLHRLININEEDIDRLDGDIRLINSRLAQILNGQNQTNTRLSRLIDLVSQKNDSFFDGYAPGAGPEKNDFDVNFNRGERK